MNKKIFFYLLERASEERRKDRERGRYGFRTVVKKWVIITEISKEVENNDIARLNVYAKQYVPRRNGASGGSYGGGGSCGRS